MSKTAAEWVQEAYNVGEKGNHKEAIECCNKAIALDPNYGEAYFYKAYYMPVHTDAEKMVIYEKAIEVGYGESWTYQNLGNNYMALGRLQDAINTYHKVIEIDNSLNFFWSLIGLLYEQMGNKTKALEFYDLCLEKGVDLHNTYLYKGKFLSGEGKYKEALELLEKGLAELPTHIELLYQNGKLCRILGQEQKALQHFNKAISRTPENPNDWCNRGLAFIALGKREEGLSDLKRTRSELETFAEITYSPGYLSFMKSTITSIVEAEELGQKSKAIEEKLQQNPAAQKFKSVLKKLQEDKDTVQNKLIGQLSQTHNAEATKNIDDFNKLKAEFEKKLMEVQAAMQKEVAEVKKDVSKLDSKVAAIENNLEILKEEIDNKLDDFNKKLSTELDKQDLKPEDKEKVLGYFKAFIGTISSIHVTSQVVDSGQVSLDTGSSATTILSTLASFAPFVGDLLSSGITTVGEFMKSKELKRNARKVKGLAPDASSLSQLIGGAAYKIVMDKKKQEEIIKTGDEDVKQKFSNVFQKIMAFCEKLDEDLDVYLYSALYKTPSEIMGHQDANDLIEKWIKGIITPVGVQEEFVKHTLNPNLGKEGTTSTGEKSVQKAPRSGCCTMF